MQFPDVKKFHDAFEYRDGKLYNKTARNSRTKIGEVAGSYSSRYVQITFEGKSWLAHRIIFFMFHGYEPKFIDHINGNKKDNRIENLREATLSQNQFNHGLNSANKSGVKGVSWSKKYQKWFACMRNNGKNKNLGLFSSLEDAKEFVELARELAHGSFHNHGTFKENIFCQ